jgi:hypothetical protein
MDFRFLDELKKLREKSTTDENDPDRFFLLSLLPMMKQLSPADNMNIKIEILETFRRKPAAPVQNSYWFHQQDYSINSPSADSSHSSTTYSEYPNFSCATPNYQQK